MNKLQILIAIALLSFLIPHKSLAAIDTWQQGFHLRLNNQTTQQIDSSLQELADTGVNYLTISPGWITSSTTSHNVDRKSSTPPDSKVVYTINKAHSLGMKVMLKPHLDIAGGKWRANLNPTDKTKFFINYKNMIMDYANIAVQTGVEQFCVGAELIALSTNPDNKTQWKNLIASVKEIYDGPIIYSANADIYSKENEVAKLTFWEDLDYLGMSFYRPLASDDRPTVESIKEKWAHWEQTYILPNKDLVNKPVIFTETGYRSINGAGLRPWDYTQTGNTDQQEQNDLYKGFFEFWKDKEYFKGVHFWEWEAGTSIDPASDKDYTPQKKLAQQTIKDYFGGTDTEPTENPEEEPTPQGLISNLNRYTLGKINIGTSFFSDRSYTITILPTLLQNQDFIKTKNEDKLNTTTTDFLKFNLNETAYVYVAYDSRATAIPNWLNTYTKTVGTIGTSDTTYNLYKKEFSASQIVLGGNVATPGNARSNYFVIISKNSLADATTTPTEPTPTPEPEETPQEEEPTTGTINLVNPRNNDVMSGEKKLKINIEGVELQNYTATYNVDGRGEVNMPNDATLNYKQSKIDFDTWTWNGEGPYTVVIKAKDLSGNTIDTKIITLYVDN